MSVDPGIDLVDEMEKIEEVAAKRCKTDCKELADTNEGIVIEAKDNTMETSFDDLPDDILLKFFAYADLPSRLKLRLNNRLNRLESLVRNNLEDIEVLISDDGYEINLETSLYRYRHKYYDFTNFDTLNRLALNSSVENIWICMGKSPNEENSRVIDVLSHFKTRSLTIGGVQRQLYPSNLPHINLSTLLTLSWNVRNLKIDFVSTSLSAQDLCIIRKIILEGYCKMKEFEMPMTEEMMNKFMKECFGVTIEDEFEPRYTKIYRSANKSIEFIGLSDVFRPFLAHFECDFQTTINSRFISFKKGNRDFLPGDKYKKIMMNHLYVK